jgi:FAD/FMN-containing dehydrogenase
MLSVEALIPDLIHLLGDSNVIGTPGQRQRYSRDAFVNYGNHSDSEFFKRTTDLVVRPNSVAQVVEIVRMANSQQIPLIPYGGGTGVMGAVVPIKGGITLDMKQLSSMLDIDEYSRTVTVGAGMLLGDLAKEMSKRHLLLGHDPWSQPIATVGGAVSTNGVGYLAGRYGPIGDQIIGLKVVLPQGELLQTKAVSKSSPGPSLDRLFIGSEGVFGIITEVTLRVFPKPESTNIYALSFDSFESGFKSIMEIYSLDLRPFLVDFAEEFSAAGTKHDIILYLGFDGFDEEVQTASQRGLQICHRHGATQLEPEVAGAFWKTRHASAERYQRDIINAPMSVPPSRSWKMEYVHVALPPSRVLQYRKRVSHILELHGSTVREWSIWGRPDLFSFLMTEPTTIGKQGPQNTEDLLDEVLILAQDMGGTVEYCHGVGLKLSHLMGRELGTGIDLLRNLKKSLDPNNIMNPGKLGV